MTHPEVTLVRHGQTEWSKSGRHTGLTDVPLTDLGRRQAKTLAGMLDGVGYDLVQSSPLSRAWETMELAGFADSAIDNGDLVEWDYGEFEGVPTAEVRKDVPSWTVWTHLIRKGESIEDVGLRADRVIADLRERDGSILVFGHGHFSRILAARWVGLPAAAGQHLSLSTATVSTLGWERETPVVTSWNVECHLRSGDPLP